jgi:Ca2+-binding EF-hand superfamily protein
MPRKKSDIGLPKDMTPDTAYIQGVADGLTEIIETQEQVSFTTFRPINVPIPAVRRELAALSADGFETITLEDFLQMIHRLVREARNEG